MVAAQRGRPSIISFLIMVYIGKVTMATLNYMSGSSELDVPAEASLPKLPELLTKVAGARLSLDRLRILNVYIIVKIYRGRRFVT